jgi:hypothetical protein
VKREAGSGFGPKPRNRAAVARFWARRVKRQRRMVCRGRVVACVRWWWWWGRASAKREAGSGFRSRNQNRAAMARFWAAVELRGVEKGAVGLQPPSHAKLEGGMGGEVVWWMVVVVLTC